MMHITGLYFSVNCFSVLNFNSDDNISYFVITQVVKSTLCVCVCVCV